MSEAANPPKFPWPDANGVWATYDLHCHCGAVKYKLRISPPLYEEHAEGKERYAAGDCDCSLCERHGIQSIHPLAENVEFTQGADERKFYYFAAKKCPTWFCQHCGSVIGIDMTPLLESMGLPARYAINVRMLKDYDPSKVIVVPKKGMKNMGPKYEV